MNNPDGNPEFRRLVLSLLTKKEIEELYNYLNYDIPVSKKTEMYYKISRTIAIAILYPDRKTILTHLN